MGLDSGAMFDDTGARARLKALGFDDVETLSSGMEGRVFRLPDEKIAKVWFVYSMDDLALLQAFYRTLGALDLPFRTPEIFSLYFIDGAAISIERELPGQPLRAIVSMDDDSVAAFAKEAMLTILGSLSAANVHGTVPDLPMLGVPFAGIQSGRTWIQGMLDVLDVKIVRFGEQLRISIRDFDWIVERVKKHLTHLPKTKMCIVHGDLTPENILIDERGNLTAVLDWGMLTCFGDPAFDASISAGVFNMYGAASRSIEARLMRLYEEKLGCGIDRMLLYRAVMAILSSNAFSADGSDGHYPWAVATLQRNDIREALARAFID